MSFVSLNYSDWFRKFHFFKKQSVLLRFVLLFSLVVYLLTSESTSLIILGGVMLGFFWQQVAFVGHDVGHNSVTHIR